MRTLTSTVAAASKKDATQPVYLLRLGFSVDIEAATWDQDIIFDGQTWIKSGIEVKNLTLTGGSIEFPLTTDDIWLGLILNEGTRGRSVAIYLHYTDATLSPQSDADLIFTGIMDEAVLTDKIRCPVIESSQAKQFPPDSIDQPLFNHLLPSGTRIAWQGDVIVVN